MDQKAEFRHDLIEEFFRLGLMAIAVPDEYGGSGGTFFQTILAIEELSAVDPSAGVIVDVQNTLVTNAILRWGTEAQKRRYLPRLAADTVGAYALSEAGSGSDAFAMSTRADKHGDHFVLNGRKLWITNAKEAGMFLLFANANPEAGYRGITAFLIEPNMPGFKVGRKEDKLGIRASSTCELLLEDCRIPAENVVGEIGKGYKIAIETLNEGRIGIGAQMFGLARGAYEQALGYAQQRKQFGKPIGEFQALRFQLAEMALDVELARTMTYNAARLKDAGGCCKGGGHGKDLSSQVAERVSSEAIRYLAATVLPKIIPWRNTGAIRRSVKSMRALRTCSYKPSQI